MDELTLKARVENIPVVADFVEKALEKAGFPEPKIIQINIAIDEIYSNIAKYGYEDENSVITVKLDILENPKRMELIFIDSGIKYNPLTEAKEPDITLALHEREIGGLGIFMVKQTMDSVSYEYKDGQNVLKIVRNA